jgi:hypothetical protein
MTNAEYYLKEGVNIDEFTFKFDDWHLKNSNVVGYGEALFRFLQEEAKPTLLEDERVILRNIEFKDYNIIGRKESGDLYVNYQENDSFNGVWLIMFKKHLFQFIKNGEEYEIAKLLKGE